MTTGSVGVVWIVMGGVLIWFVTLAVLGVCRKGQLVPSRANWLDRFFNLFLYLPIAGMCLLLGLATGSWLVSLAILVTPPLIRALYSKPKRESLKSEMDRLYAASSHTNPNPRYSFSGGDAIAVCDQDQESWINGIWPVVSLDRVGKNRHGEYFRVHQSFPSREVVVSHLTFETAKNFIRSDKKAFLREFGA
ncbi:MAG: hypothetical protein ACR2JA_11860 [Hydrogenophaga sp.]|uniref:hypothetical protein n=1 Tax=Hydrogenophaga sp. TaxID=1904254 RepID=UPI003D9B5240